MSNIFPIDFEEKLTMAQDDYILFSDSEDGNKIKKAQYKNLKGEPGTPGTPGTPGKDGEDGAAATITVGSTTTGAAGSSASVTNSGTSSAAVLDFTIPQGAKGEPGEDGQDGADGAAATITVGTTTTLPAGSSATVTNVGTSQDAILNFGIPKGDSGSGSGDVNGPASSTDGHIAVFDGATGKLIKDGGAIPTGDVGVSTDTGTLLSAGVDLWLGTETDFSSISTPDTNTLYIQYKSDGGGGWTPGVNTVLYLPLDGDVVDYSSAGRTFTVLGSTSATGTPVFDTVQGTKQCASFIATDETTSNWFAYTSDLTGIPTSGNMTVSLWMNWQGIVPHHGDPSSNYYQGIVDCRSNNGYTWMCMMRENTNEIMFHGTAQEISSFVPTVGTWYNIIAVIDSGTCYIYKDGVQIYSDSYAYGSGADKLCLGGWYNTQQSSMRDDAYKGKLADVIVENVARTAQEISDYYDQTKGEYGIS